MTTVFRASRRATGFDPLDASGSVGRNGWRFNDRDTPILYAASVQSLSILEVVARPGWEAVGVLTVFPIEIPEAGLATLEELGITLPTNWNNRPAGAAARQIGAQLIQAIDRAEGEGTHIYGLHVPSVISTTDTNVLLDPRQVEAYRVGQPARIPFDWLVGSGT